MRPFISFEEDDRHQLSCEREGDKYQERDKLRVWGTIAKLDMLWRLSTIQKNRKRIYRGRAANLPLPGWWRGELNFGDG